MSAPPEHMGEDELLERARKAMLKAVTLPLGSLERSVQWGVYDTYADELQRRAIMLITGKTR